MEQKEHHMEPELNQLPSHGGSDEGSWKRSEMSVYSNLLGILIGRSAAISQAGNEGNVKASTSSFAGRKKLQVQAQGGEGLT
jgi:hypothetical protein